MELKFSRVKEVYDHFINPSLKFDRKFIEETKKWLLRFQRKNHEHVAFFSSAYFGYHLPKWRNEEDEYWLYDVIGIDEDEIAEYVHQCPYIDKDHAVSSNILSLGLLYLMHRVDTEKSLSQSDRDAGKMALMQVMVTRYITGLMFKYFPRGATSIEIATETFNRLSRRFDLKEQGSWQAFIEKRSEVFTIGEYSREAKHEKQAVFQTFDDELVVKKLNAVKTSLNRAMVEINDVFRSVLTDKDRVKLTSAMKLGEDGLYVEDITNQYQTYLTYQTKILQDKQAFLKYDLMGVIESSLPTISVNIFRDTLEWMVDSITDRTIGKQVDEMRENILLYGMELMQEEEIGMGDMAQIATRLRQNFVSGKANDERLVKCRKIVDNLIIKFRPKSKGKVITSERTAILMYFVLRTLAMKYYS